jgi:hypothetical protein
MMRTGTGTEGAGGGQEGGAGEGGDDDGESGEDMLMRTPCLRLHFRCDP